MPDSNPDCPVHILMMQNNETEIVKYISKYGYKTSYSST
jgi:hypothetical protein